MVKLGVFFESDKSRSVGPSEHWQHSAFLSLGTPCPWWRKVHQQVEPRGPRVHSPLESTTLCEPRSCLIGGESLRQFVKQRTLDGVHLQPSNASSSPSPPVQLGREGRGTGVSHGLGRARRSLCVTQEQALWLCSGLGLATSVCARAKEPEN